MDGARVESCGGLGSGQTGDERGERTGMEARRGELWYGAIAVVFALFLLASVI